MSELSEEEIIKPIMKAIAEERNNYISKDKIEAKMNINFNGDLKDISMLLISAERYAIGRSTYIVSWICDLIKDNLTLLSNEDKQVMIQDIKTAYSYGGDIDRQDWMDLLKLLEGK